MPPAPAPGNPKPKPPPSSSADWIETETGNKVSRRAQLHGTQHITLGGRCVISPLVTIRGDLVRSAPAAAAPPPSDASKPPTTARKPAAPPTSVSLGKYTILCDSVLLRPPSRHSREKGSLVHHPLLIGSHT
ncbi:MAG: hypothetical protein Q9181_003936, partial [Wetmoreana brouardii]